MGPNLTCSACRDRKVRCDGSIPCKPCTKSRKHRECEYISLRAAAPTSKGEYLKKGAACVACRKKKKKCDAKRPFCSTCHVAGKESECTYDENLDRNLTEALFWRNQVLEQWLAAYQSQAVGPKTVLPSDSNMFSVHANPSALPDHPIASSSRVLPHISLNSFNNLPMYNYPQALDVLYSRMSAPTPTTDLHHMSLPHIPLNFDEFRRTFYDHAAQFGCMLSSNKMQAVMSGDTTGRIVHPAFTYIAQLHGCFLWQLERRSYIFQSVENEQLQYLFATLANIDPVSEVQIRYVLACYYLVKQQMQDGEEQLVIAADVVHRHNLTFPTGNVDSMDPLQVLEATEEQSELITALSHLLYLDRASSFVFRVPMRLDKSFDEAFKNVAVFFPELAKTNLVYLRTQSLLLFIRASELSHQWGPFNSPACPGAVFSAARGAWFQSYWSALEDVTKHAANLDTQMLRTSFNDEHAQTVALKFSIVVALSGKAQLHWLLHHDQPESKQRALDVVMEVVGVTRTFQDGDFNLLDPILGRCWDAVVNIVVEAMNGPSVLQQHRGEISWPSALRTIDMSAKKLGCEIPFMDESVQRISEVVRDVPV